VINSSRLLSRPVGAAVFAIAAAVFVGVGCEQLGVSPALPVRVARAADTMPVPADIRVRLGVRVPLRAVSLGSMRTPVAPLRHHVEDVCGLVTEKQVVWPNASGIVAAMKDPQSDGNWPVGQLPRYAMRKMRSPRLLDEDHAVSLRVAARCPLPAPISRATDFLPKSLGKRSRFHSRTLMTYAARVNHILRDFSWP
jgi:hypothetical protein